MKFIELDSVESTNNFASDLIAKKSVHENTLIYTFSQTKGKGLGVNTWQSEDNKNLIFSLIVFPNFEADNHFVLSMIVSLSICEYLHFKGVSAKIKWPNDIYLKNSKLAGILIENSIQGNYIKNSIIGIGLNMNQIEFPKNLFNPISLSNATNLTYDITEEVKLLAEIINNRISSFSEFSISEIKTAYLNKLYRFNKFHNYITKGKVFKARIIDVKLDGYLVLETEDKLVKEYYFKELEFYSLRS